MAIVIAVIMSSCSNEDYKSYVPADSKMVGKIDLKEFFVQTGVDQEKFFKDIVEQYGDDVADFKNSGLDLTSPLYIFARNSGSEIVYGIVAKVADRAMAENYYAKSSKKTLKKAADYSYDVDAAASVAINDEAMLVVGKSNRDKDSMEKTLTRIMSKDFNGNLGENRIFAQADGSSSFASSFSCSLLASETVDLMVTTVSRTVMSFICSISMSITFRSAIRYSSRTG